MVEEETKAYSWPLTSIHIPLQIKSESNENELFPLSYWNNALIIKRGKPGVRKSSEGRCLLLPGLQLADFESVLVLSVFTQMHFYLLYSILSSDRVTDISCSPHSRLLCPLCGHSWTVSGRSLNRHWPTLVFSAQSAWETHIPPSTPQTAQGPGMSPKWSMWYRIPSLFPFLRHLLPTCDHFERYSPSRSGT